MPYCTQCGGQVRDTDLYCASCGSQQEGAAPSAGPGAGPRQAASSDFFKNVTPRTASMLCYIPVIGWIPAIIILASQKFRRDRSVRFHAFQGLYLFVAWLIVDWGLIPFFSFPTGFGAVKLQNIFKAGLMAIWIFMLIKTSQREDFRLPIFGDLAERSVAEQR
jgi:uncharacterized membrane protein